MPAGQVRAVDTRLTHLLSRTAEVIQKMLHCLFERVLDKISIHQVSRDSRLSDIEGIDTDMSILGTAEGSRKKERKRKKPDELLSSVVRETAVPAAVELLRGNQRFAFPSGTAWVMLVVSAASLDGLSKRHSRDEAKGSIIELIESDQIHTVATADLLEQEVFGVIPTETTLARMEEYSLLTSAEYAWAVVWQRPTGQLIVQLVAEATFNQARQVATGHLSLEAAVGDAAWAEHSGQAAGTESQSAATGAADNEAATYAEEGDQIFDEAAVRMDFEDEAVFTDEDEFEGLVHDGAVAAPAAEEYLEQDEAAYVNGHIDGYAEDTDLEDEGAPEGTYLEDSTAAVDQIARRFLTEDLDLDIRLDEFNTSFAVGAPVVQVAVPEGASQWLGDQVAQLTRQANAALAQLHRANEDKLRTTYVNLMGQHADQVINEVATDRAGSRYKALTDSLEVHHAEALKGKEQQTRERKAEAQQRFEETAKKLAEQAAISAELQFKERNRTKLEREQAEIAAEVERHAENDYSHARQEILRMRRSDASLKMQRGQTRIFELLAEQQAENFEAERQLLDVWKAEIAATVDDNRKADLSRAEALAEQQARVNEVSVVQAEHEALLQSMKKEHEQRVRRLEEEFERERQSTLAKLSTTEAEWQHALQLEKEKTASQVERSEDLIQQLSALGTTYQQQYATRVEELEADKRAYTADLERQNQMQGRSNKILTVLMVAIPLLTLLVGFIFGVGFAN